MSKFRLSHGPMHQVKSEQYDQSLCKLTTFAQVWLFLAASFEVFVSGDFRLVSCNGGRQIVSPGSKIIVLKFKISNLLVSKLKGQYDPKCGSFYLIYQKRH